MSRSAHRWLGVAFAGFCLSNVACTELPPPSPKGEVDTGPQPVCGTDGADDCTRAVHVAAGGTFSCAVFDDDTTRCWGANDQGQLGRADLPRSLYEPPSVSDLPRFDVMALGWSHGCGLRDGRVWCWGDHRLGQLGSAEASGGPEAVDVGLTDVRKLVVHEAVNCALHGTPTQVSCWGFALDGQAYEDVTLGRARPIPTAVPGLAVGDLTDLAVGRAHACATNGNGVWCWGHGDEGQIGDNADESRAIATPADLRYVDLPILELEAGGDHTCMRAGPDAHAYCWGDLDRWFYRSVPGHLYWWRGGGAAEVAMGHRLLCARYEAGWVGCSGDNRHGQLPALGPDDERLSSLAVVGGLEDVVELSGGVFHLCARHETGAISCWGRNSEGQLGHGHTSWSEPPMQLGTMPDE